MKLTVVFFIVPNAPSVSEVSPVIPAGGFKNLLLSVSCSLGKIALTVFSSPNPVCKSIYNLS